MAKRLILYLRLIRIDRPTGYLLLLWPTLWGLWIAADGWPGWHLFLVFTAGSVLMHSAGCAINDFADMHFDRQVRRTKDRPLATGEIRPVEAIMVAVVLTGLAFALIWQFSLLTKKIAAVALFFAATYPWFKRFFAVPQAWLGIAFGFGIPMAFAAVGGDVPKIAWVLMLANMFWTLAYDTQYAMVDREDDLKTGMRTSAITLGRHDVTGIMLFYGAMLAVFFAAGLYAGLGNCFRVSVACAALCVILQYSLIRTRDPKKCYRAFHCNNLIGIALFAGIWLDYAFWAAS